MRKSLLRRRTATITETWGKVELAGIKEPLGADRDFASPLVEAVVQEVLETEMTEALRAGKGERTEARLG